MIVEKFDEININLYQSVCALVIGINSYNKLPKLRGAINDCTHISDLLGNDFNVKKLVNKNASKEGILAQMKEMTRGLEYNEYLIDKNTVETSKRNLFIIYFAGHGMVNENTKGGDSIFNICPVDFDPEDAKETGIKVSTIKKIICKMDHVHCLLVLDCCFGAKSFDKVNLDQLPFLENFFHNSFWVISAGGDKKETFEKTFDDEERGIFSYYFEKVLEKEGKKDLMTPELIVEEVRKRLDRDNYTENIPHFSSLVDKKSGLIGTLHLSVSKTNYFFKTEKSEFEKAKKKL
eukprot:TRINITY_DN12017_c0_g1_i1.p1 TRINITY_DN12017_c0_g1~~TRINITY_DN12017_c0_g1_i1.p1  ORF type:complete len:291 (-),score=68.45 TRINITY_DN12017_c0_g1_i1:88-960(-)